MYQKVFLRNCVSSELRGYCACVPRRGTHSNKLISLWKLWLNKSDWYAWVYVVPTFIMYACILYINICTYLHYNIRLTFRIMCLRLYIICKGANILKVRYIPRFSIVLYAHRIQVYTRQTIIYSRNSLDKMHLVCVMCERE